MSTSQLPTEPGQFEPDQKYPIEQRDGYQQSPSYPPQQQTEYPQYPPQFPPQQEWQQPPMQPMQPHQSPKRHRGRRVFGIGCGAVVALIVLSIIIAVAMSNGATTNPNTNSNKNTNPSANTQPTPTTQPTSQPTVQPTVIPTETQAQIEADYKASAVSATVTSLDKDGSADTGMVVHFTATISKFVKDTSGITAGANVSGTDNSGSFVSIQVEFTPGTDISQLNEGDTIEVWGVDDGSFSGTNAFGGTVQEVAISAAYLFDHTTNYQANA